MTAYRFLEPLDVLFLRGNKLFGDPGSYGASLVPPWPSVAAGALLYRDGPPVVLDRLWRCEHSWRLGGMVRLVLPSRPLSCDRVNWRACTSRRGAVSAAGELGF